MAASSAGELVSGTTSGLMALTGSAATFGANFTLGGTATASGLLMATNTAASSTLTVGDAGSGAGRRARRASAAPAATRSSPMR